MLAATVPQFEATNRRRFILAGATAASIFLQVSAVLVARCVDPRGRGVCVFSNRLISHRYNSATPPETGSNLPM